jgi:LmbE family N-acetylglucosaminyl deacetylase
MPLPHPIRRAAIRTFARIKPAIPDRAWPLLTAMRSVGGDAPLIAAPALRRVLVLAAHPDDESLGCAGTIALLRKAGAAVSVAFATDGEATIGADLAPAETARRRRNEAVTACGILGVHDIRFWGLPDGSLSDRVHDLARDIADLMADVRPDGVLLPWFLDGHADHAALSAALARKPPDNAVEVWGYETWTPLPANRLVDITGVWTQKEQALDAHVTAALAFDLRAGLGLNRWRSLHGLMGRGYAEGFLVAPAPTWLDWRAQAVPGV